MAKVKLHPALQHISGKMGEMVFRHIQDEGQDKTELADAPSYAEDRKFSEKQLVQQQVMRQAVLYGKSVMADEHLKEGYLEELKKEGKNLRRLFSLIVADFMHAPSIDEVDLSEYSGDVDSKIKVRASDDFKVTKLEILIVAADGKILEQGQAKEESGFFVYTAQTNVHNQDIKIDVRIYDVPGHKTEKEVGKKV